MSPNTRPSSLININPKVKTPLKASVVMITTLVLASCASNEGAKNYTLGDIFGQTPQVTDPAKPTPSSVSANYANGVVSGKVTDKDGKPIEGLTVTVDLPNGKSVPATTNANGEYQVEIPADAVPTANQNITVKVDGSDVSDTTTVGTDGGTDGGTGDGEGTGTGDGEGTGTDGGTDGYSSPAESAKSGVQHLLIDTTAIGLSEVAEMTTRDFDIRSSSDVDARADLALAGTVKEPISLTVSSDNDTETTSGFKSYDGKTTVKLGGNPQDVNYTSVYKDFGNDELRIAHVDGEVLYKAGTAQLEIPVDGVALVGNATQTLPTEGTFDYVGDATYRKTGQNQTIEYGTSVFTADFVNNKLAGKLDFNNVDDINLSADIDGNTFSGSADKNAGYNTEGGFYGKDAGFLGGVYEGNGAQGTYGGKKQ